MNKQTREIVFLGIAILLGICIIIPFILPEQVTGKFITGFSFVSAFCSIATLIIAFLLYDKFGIAKTIIDKKVNVVLELLEHFKGGRILAKYTRNEGEKIITSVRVIRPKKDMSSYLEKGTNGLLIAVNSNDYYNGMDKVSTLKNNIWMPKEIAVKLEPLQFYSFYKDEKIQNNIEKYIRLQLGVGSLTDKNQDENWMRPGNTEISFEVYLQNIESVFKAIENWLEKHTNMSIEINY